MILIARCCLHNVIVHAACVLPEHAVAVPQTVDRMKRANAVVIQIP